MGKMLEVKSYDLDRDKVNDDGVRNLACAVCLYAAADYKNGLKNAKKYPQKKMPSSFYTAEHFMKSPLFSNYSGGMNGLEVIAELREQVHKELSGECKPRKIKAEKL